jgi:hypothetical protein
MVMNMFIRKGRLDIAQDVLKLLCIDRERATAAGEDDFTLATLDKAGIWDK